MLESRKCTPDNLCWPCIDFGLELARQHRIEADSDITAGIREPEEPHPGRKVSFSSGSDDSDWAELTEGNTQESDAEFSDTSISPKPREKREDQLKSCRVSFTTQWTIDGVSPFIGRTLIPKGRGDTVRSRRRFVQYLRRKGMSVKKSECEVLERDGRSVIGATLPVSKPRVAKSPDFRERKGKT